MSAGLCIHYTRADHGIRLGEVLLDARAWRFEFEEVTLHILSFVGYRGANPLKQRGGVMLTQVIV